MYLMTGPFEDIMDDLRMMFLKTAQVVDVGEWHSQPVDNPLLVSRELQDTIIVYRTPVPIQMLQDEVKPNLPWAEDHFLERVSGRPLNPPPSNEWWPFAEAGNARHKTEGVFSHTYPERFWPKHAGELGRVMAADPEEWARWITNNINLRTHFGLRYHYGDLNSVVEQLRDNPETRQAYLPVWFPEDTGAESGQRVPCTLGYHFMIRNGQLSCNYYIRSCDFVRHFRDDLYMAARLTQWICSKLTEVMPGEVKMYISSFHIFEGDVAKVRSM